MKKFKKILFATIISIVVLSTTVVSVFADGRPGTSFNYYTFGADELIIKNSTYDDVGIYAFDKVLGNDIREYFANNPNVDNLVYKDKLSVYNWQTNNRLAGIDCYHDITPINTPSSYLRDIFSIELYEDDNYIYNDFSARYSNFVINLNTSSQYLPLFSISLNPHTTEETLSNEDITQFYLDFAKTCTVTAFYYSDNGTIARYDGTLNSFPTYDEYATMNYYFNFDSLSTTDIYKDTQGYSFIQTLFVYSSEGIVSKTDYDDCSVNFFSYVGDSHYFVINDEDSNFYSVVSNDVRLFDSTYLSNLIDSDLVDTTDFNFWSFLTTSIGGFFDFEIFPGLSFGGVGLACIGIGLLFAVLKYFAGG